MPEAKKRTIEEGAEQSHSKKRAVSDGRDSPSHVNGVASHPDEPKDSDNLEVFRKDAIYRRMKHYSRQFERSEARIAELERRRTTCEAGLAALEACWSQIIGTIRLLTKPEDLPPVNLDTKDLYDLTSRVSDDADPAYLDALRDKMHVTSELVGAFVRLGGQVHATMQDDLYKDCQKAQTECFSLRSELLLARTRLRDVENERDKYRNDLVLAEQRLDRAQSKVVVAAHGQETETVTQITSSLDSPSSPAPAPAPVDGDLPPDSWKAIALSREQLINQLNTRGSKIHADMVSAKLQLAAISEAQFAESPFGKAMSLKVSELERKVEDRESKISKLKEEFEESRVNRADSETHLRAAIDHATQEFKTAISQRDNDITRIRASRDRYQSELNERKHKDQIKVNSLQEFKNLADARSERIVLLQSEVTRLRTRIAANAGDEKLMSALFRDYTDDMQSHLQKLQEQLFSTESRTNALQESLAQLQLDHPDIARHIQSESDVRERLSKAETQLREYQSMFGEAESDFQKLAEQLRLKEADIQKLQLQEKQRDQAEAALYAELEKLSVAWEALDRQVQNKVFDLSAMEEKLGKAGAEKAKADNKYYAAMREKEATEVERKAIARKLERQGHLTESLGAEVKSLKERVSSLEDGNTALQKACDVVIDANTSLQAENAQLKILAKGQERSAHEHLGELHRLRKALEGEIEQLKQISANMAVQKQDFERQSAKLKQSVNSTSKEAQLQSEIDKCMSILKCSTCRQNMRNTVITRCMHSFCKSCVESRITTRQRKCPACNIAFTQGEVQQLYFQ